MVIDIEIASISLLFEYSISHDIVILFDQDLEQTVKVFKILRLICIYPKYCSLKFSKDFYYLKSE